MDKLLLLRKVPLFSSLRVAELRRFSERVEVRVFKKGDIIYEEGKPAGEVLYIVAAGQLNVLLGGKILSTLSCPNYFGEVSLLTEESHSATVRAVTSGRLLVIKKKLFEEIVRKHPEVLQSLSRVLGKKLRQTTQFSHKEQQEQRVLVVLSAESKAGKSVLTANLAASLLKQTGKKIALLDFYHSPQSAAGLLKLKPKLTLSDIIKKHRGITIDDFQRCVVRHSSGVEIIGFYRKGETMEVNVQTLAQVFQLLKEIYEMIVVDLPSALDLEQLGVLMNEADEAIFLFKEDPVSFQKGESYLSCLKSRVSNLGAKLWVGVLLERGEMHKKPPFYCNFVLPFDKGAVDFSLTYGNPVVASLPACQLSWSIDRLAREMANIRVGVALSAGMASSLAHIGALKVLYRENIPIDIMAGTSGGAMCGALYAAGVSPLKLEKALQKLGKLRILSFLDFTLPFAGFIRGKRIVNFIKAFIGNLRFEELLLPLKVIATDFYTGEVFIIDKGEISDALRASISIPGIFIPHKYMGRFLVDGATVSPLPVDILYRSGADKVIAVNTCVDPLVCRKEEGNLPHFFDVITHSRAITSHHLAEIESHKADLAICPDTAAFRWRDYHLSEEIIAAGEKAAEESLPQVRALLRMN